MTRVLIVFFLSTLLLPFPVRECSAKVTDIVVEDKSSFSRVTVFLDKERRYKLSREGKNAFVLLIDDDSKSFKSRGRSKSRVVKSVSPFDSPSGKAALKISFEGQINDFSDFYLSSPPRIVLNLSTAKPHLLPEKQKKEANKPNPSAALPEVPRKKEKTVKKEPLKVREKTGAKPASSEQTVPDKGLASSAFRNEDDLAAMQGFEDLVMPSLSPFVEIFDTEESLSVYNISFPEGTLSDYPEREKVMGLYFLKNPHLINASRNMEEGDYERALLNIKRAEQKVGRSDDYHFLRADAEYQKALAGEGLLEAVKLYEAAVDLFPDSKHSPWALMQAGRGMMSLGMYTEAEGYFERLVRDYKDSPYVGIAKLGLAKAFSKMNKKDQSIVLFKEFIVNNPGSPYLAEALYGAARDMAHSGRYRRAYYLFENSLARWPSFPLGDPNTLMMMGESQYYMMKYDDAMTTFVRLVNLYPDNMQANRAMARMGDIYLRLRMKDAAEKVFLEVEQRYPGSDGAHIGKIRLADMLDADNGSQDKVMSLYKGVYERFIENPLSQVAVIKAGMFLLSRKNYEESFNLLKDFDRLYPKSSLKAFALKELLKVYSAMIKDRNDNKDCLELIRLIDSYPELFAATDDKETLSVFKGACYYRYAQYDLAIKILGTVKDASQLERAKELIALSYYGMSDYANAINGINAVMKDYPSRRADKTLVLPLAKSYDRKGDAKSAIEEYKRYISLESDKTARADAFISLGDVLRKSGGLAAADAYRSAAAELLPDNKLKVSELYFNVGELYYKSGDCQSALGAYSDAISYANEKRYAEAQYKAAICHDRSGEASSAIEKLKPISEASGSAFWSDLSESTISDIKWQESHDRP